jgi:hypothetical protein
MGFKGRVKGNGSKRLIPLEIPGFSARAVEAGWPWARTVKEWEAANAANAVHSEFLRASVAVAAIHELAKDIDRAEADAAARFQVMVGLEMTVQERCDFLNAQDANSAREGDD